MKKLSVLFVIIIAGVCISGCGKGYLDINTPNPNAATNATPELVITNAMSGTASAQVTNSNLRPIEFLSGWMGYWAPSGSYATNNLDVASYNQTTDFANAVWTGAYRNLEDYNYVETLAKTQAKPYYVAMAKAMKSVPFSQLVDFFNNIPYLDAFQGTIIIQPKYNSGQSIYESLAGQLDSAVILMKSPAAIAAANTDIMFNGDNASWIQFANTMKLRLLMRQTEMSGRAAYITSEIAKITANGGGFLNKDAAINPGYANNESQQNPLWGYFRTLTGLATSGGQADYYRASAYAINGLKSSNDRRLGQIYDSLGAGTYVGNVLGSQTNIPGSGTSSIGPGLLKSVSQNAIVISAAESHFLRAEAIIRGFLTGNAQTEYEAGVQASFDYLNAGSATVYLNSGNVNTTWSTAVGFNSQLALIIRQKWISENGVLPMEAYNDYRRLGLPADIPISISPYKDPIDAKVPLRFLYPTTEYTTNATNVNAEGTINSQTSKIFWSK